MRVLRQSGYNITLHYDIKIHAAGRADAQRKKIKYPEKIR